MQIGVWLTGSAQEIAERATFQSFANCYLREIDPGKPCRHGGIPLVDTIEIQLDRALRLRLEVVSHSLCGPHRLGRVWICGPAGAIWRDLMPLEATALMLRQAYSNSGVGDDQRARGQELSMLSRILQSYEQVLHHVENAKTDCGDLPDFIEAEQSLRLGHWLHPTPKSLQGMTDWQQEHYAPENRATFQLHYFAADDNLVLQSRAGEQDAGEIIAQMLGDTQSVSNATIAGKQLIPMHPLQAQALLLDPQVSALIASEQLIYLGAMGQNFTPTSSVRTLYSQNAAWMPKFSVPVKITNSRRINKLHELQAGVAIARLFERLGLASFDPRLTVIQDPAFITLTLPDRHESGFEVIFRENPFGGTQNLRVLTIAALTAEPTNSRPSLLAKLIGKAAEQDGIDHRSAARLWFERYLDCALDPLVRLYDEYGIALEAHQQNSLLDVSDYYPSHFYYRDNQGFYLSETSREHLNAHIPEADEIGDLWFDDKVIFDRFTYYLVANQIFSVISRLGHDQLLSEPDLLAALRSRLLRLSQDLPSRGGRFARSLIENPTICVKANLGFRLRGGDELAASHLDGLYIAMPNPLTLPATSNQESEVLHAIAI